MLSEKNRSIFQQYFDEFNTKNLSVLGHKLDTQHIGFPKDILAATQAYTSAREAPESDQKEANAFNAFQNLCFAVASHSAADPLLSAYPSLRILNKSALISAIRSLAKKVSSPEYYFPILAAADEPNRLVEFLLFLCENHVFYSRDELPKATLSFLYSKDADYNTDLHKLLRQTEVLAKSGAANALDTLINIEARIEDRTDFAITYAAFLDANILCNETIDMLKKDHKACLRNIAVIQQLYPKGLLKESEVQRVVLKSQHVLPAESFSEAVYFLQQNRLDFYPILEFSELVKAIDDPSIPLEKARAMDMLAKKKRKYGEHFKWYLELLLKNKEPEKLPAIIEFMHASKLLQTQPIFPIRLDEDSYRDALYYVAVNFSKTIPEHYRSASFITGIFSCVRTPNPSTALKHYCQEAEDRVAVDQDRQAAADRHSPTLFRPLATTPSAASGSLKTSKSI